jgi:hypothetical protein
MDYLHSQIFLQKNFCVLLCWPNTIKELYLNYHFDLDLNDLPSLIKILSFDGDSEYKKDLNNLPKSL